MARSNQDWHRLLELCAITNTLVIDEDGCYNPADFNDSLVLGMKGAFAQAELHIIRARRRTFEVLKVRRLSGQEMLSLRHPNLGSIAMPRDWTDWAPPGAQPPPECAPLLIDVFALVCLAEFVACLKYRDEGLDR